jgi:hypothetical protein
MIIARPAAGCSLAPFAAALAGLRQRRGPDATVGLAPELLVPAGSPGWTPASELLAGGLLDQLLAAAAQRWNATPAAAAALAWRSYTYWLVLPVVLGWGGFRRVPLLAPEDVLVRIGEPGSPRLVTIGLRRLRLAVLADDPLTGGPAPATGGPVQLTGGPAPATGQPAGRPALTVLGSGPRLLAELRATLRDHHLDPLLARLRGRVNLGARTLLGSLASAVAYGVVRGLDAPSAELTATAGTLLSALDVADLVTLEPGPDGPVVQRRTCCLAFTLPRPKICSGCCLRGRQVAV